MSLSWAGLRPAEVEAEVDPMDGLETIIPPQASIPEKWAALGFELLENEARVGIAVKHVDRLTHCDALDRLSRTGITF